MTRSCIRGMDFQWPKYSTHRTVHEPRCKGQAPAYNRKAQNVQYGADTSDDTRMHLIMDKDKQLRRRDMIPTNPGTNLPFQPPDNHLRLTHRLALYPACSYMEYMDSFTLMAWVQVQCYFTLTWAIQANQERKEKKHSHLHLIIPFSATAGHPPLLFATALPKQARLQKPRHLACFFFLRSVHLYSRLCLKLSGRGTYQRDFGSELFLSVPDQHRPKV
ncbi:hypothetical protein V8C35DRAFT_108479 [Trichoderma chlorosporum]